MSALGTISRSLHSVTSNSTAAGQANSGDTARRAALRGDVIAASPHLNAHRSDEATNSRATLIRALLQHVPAGDRTAATTAIPAILSAARHSGNSDPNRIAYLLATAQTESDFGANMTETGHSKQWFNATYGGVDGNRPGSTDGYTYRGRGYVQATHAGRYAELSRLLGLPDVRVHANGRVTTQPALVAQPEKLAEPAIAAKALVIGVERNRFTANPAAALDKTIPLGRPPGDADFYHARGIVNGIVPAQARTIAAHAIIYAQILAGYSRSVLEIQGR